MTAEQHIRLVSWCKGVHMPPATTIEVAAGCRTVHQQLVASRCSEIAIAKGHVSHLMSVPVSIAVQRLLPGPAVTMVVQLCRASGGHIACRHGH